MSIGGPTTRILGFVALIAAGGCGSGSGRPTVPPPDALAALVPGTVPPAASAARVPGTIDPDISPLPDAASPAPVLEAREGPSPVPGLRRSFDAPVRAPAVATGDPELDPLVSYLKASFSAVIKDGRRLVFDDTTDLGMLPFDTTYDDLMDGMLRKASDRIPADMLRDFVEKNRKSHAVTPALTRHLPARLLADGEREAIFSAGADKGWKDFYASYPDAHGMLTISRVGLNLDKTLAVFRVGVSQASLLHYGQIHVLRRDGDTWVELPIDIGWAPIP